jgi:hypothetical protein
MGLPRARGEDAIDWGVEDMVGVVAERLDANREDDAEDVLLAVTGGKEFFNAGFGRPRRVSNIILVARA